MSNDLKSNGEHAGGANNDFPKFAPGDNADKVLSASYQNKLIAGVERANRKAYGSGVIDFGPVSLQKGQRRAPESGNRIRVRLDYPYRAPMGAVVGVDFPILDEAIEDQYDLVNFLNDPVTTYSCSKNQYRHHNRIAILEQELLPGQTGWAVISGVAKTFWHAQRPIHAESGPSQGVHDTIDEIPAQSTNAAIDEYKQLGILGADFAAGGAYSDLSQNSGDEFGFANISGNILWKNRSRPWWLAPYVRTRAYDAAGNEIGAEISYPYGDSHSSSYRSHPIASSRGRVTSVGGHAVPIPTCTGNSTVKCIGGQYRVVDSTCSSACSSWFVIENYTAANYYGIDTPCTEGNEVSGIPCISEYPYRDNDWSNTEEISELSASGAWISSNSVELGWIAGTVVLGTPESFANSDGERRNYSSSGDDSSTDELDPSELPSPYSYIAYAEEWAKIAMSCANLTCTYTCDGANWTLARGEEPYNLDDNWRCKCPTDWLTMMSSHDIPCNMNSQPREITLGMVYSHVDTTTSTTTTSSTTTTTCSTSSQCGMTCILGPNPSNPTHPTYMWAISGCHSFANDCPCAYDDIVSIPYGLACNPDGIPGPDYGAINCGDDPPAVGACCGIGTDCTQCAIVTSDMCGGLGGTYQGDGTDCSDCSVPIYGACCFTVPGAGILGTDFHGCRGTTECGCAKTDEIYPNAIDMTYLGDGTSCGSGDCTSTTTTSSTTTTTGTSSTTTSSTTTTTEGSTTTTSSTTTTTAAPTGACCISGVCSITTGADCVSNAGTYQGNGTTCSPDPCTGSSTTTSSSTTTTEGSSSTTTSSTTTTTGACSGTCSNTCEFTGNDTFGNPTYGWTGTFNATCSGGVNCGCTDAWGACGPDNLGVLTLACVEA